MTRLKVIWSQLKRGVKVSVVRRFWSFLILIGLVPNFSDFLYYYAFDRLNLTKFQVSASTSINGIVIIVLPIVYLKFFS